MPQPAQTRVFALPNLWIHIASSLREQRCMRREQLDAAGAKDFTVANSPKLTTAAGRTNLIV
jgi:hypothetical protein